MALDINVQSMPTRRRRFMSLKVVKLGVIHEDCRHEPAGQRAIAGEAADGIIT
jgi:hypothetical protein